MGYDAEFWMGYINGDPQGILYTCMDGLIRLGYCNIIFLDTSHELACSFVLSG